MGWRYGMRRRHQIRKGGFGRLVRVPVGAVGLSAFVRVATFPITALATFLAASLTIGYAGVEGYAAIIVISTLAQLVPYADLGIGAGLINAISTASSEDPARLSATASAVRMLCLSAVILLVLGVAGMTLFSWSDFLNLEASGLPHLDLVTFLVVAVIAVMVPLGIGQRILVALAMNPSAVAITAIAPVFSLICTGLIVASNLPAVILVFPPAIGALLVAIVSMWLAARKLGFGWRMACDTRINRYPGLLSQGMWYLALSIASALSFQWGRVILATRGTLAEVASYSIAMQLYAPLWSFFIAAGTALWPVFAKNRALKLGQLPILRRMLVGFGLMSVVAAAGLLFAGPWLAGVISRGSIVSGPLLFASCGALIVAQSAQLVLGVSLTAPRDLRFQALWGIPMAAAIVGATWLLVPILGEISPFVASASGVLIFQVTPNIFRVLANERLRVAESFSRDLAFR